MRAHCLRLVLLLAFGAGPLAAQQIVLVVPRASQNAGQVTNLAFANPSDESAVVRVEYLDALGFLQLDPVELTLGPGVQIARNLAEEDLFGAEAADSEGWIFASSDNISVVGFFLSSSPDSSRIDGAQALAGGEVAEALVFPELLFGPGQSTEIGLVAFGEPGELIEIDIQLRAGDGSLLAEESRTLPPFPELGSQMAASLGDLFAEIPPQAAYLRAEGNGASLLGFEEFGDAQATAARNAIPVGDFTESPSSLFGAQLASGSLVSTVTIINPTPIDARLTLTATPTSDDMVNTPVSVERDLPEGAALRASAADLFGLQSDFVGSLRMNADVTGLVGVVTFGATDGGFLASVELQSIPVSDILYSQVAELDEQGGFPGAFTGITFLNPNEAASQVDIEVFDDIGIPTGSGQITLASGEHRPQLLSELIPGFRQAGGSIRIRSELPVFTFELFGFTSGGAPTAFSAVPPQRISGRLEGTLSTPGGPPPGEIGEVFVLALDPGTQLVQFSAIAQGGGFSFLVFNGSYELVAGDDPDGDGLICEGDAEEFCGALPEPVRVEAGQTVSGLTIELAQDGGAPLRRRAIPVKLSP